MIYSILNKYKPETYLEIGSGTSTLVAAKAIRENKLHTQIVSIDPKPREQVDKVCLQVHRKLLQEVDLSIFENLKENDILFLDGSHMLLPNSDVTYFFLEILPIIKKGVIIHIHDIYLPYDYPDFMLNRFYNEQYILASTILANPVSFNIICPNFYIFENKMLHSILNPIWGLKELKKVETHGGSFWMQKQ